MTEQASLAAVRFTCADCGQTFDYTPGLIGPDIQVRVRIEKINGRCVRHEPGLVVVRDA